MTAKPLISEEELEEIKTLEKVEEEAWVMATHSNYSPWVLGYSKRKTIAPGLFDNDKWGLEKWKIFWNASKYSEVKDLLEMYEKPLYIHVGNTYGGKRELFQDKCFEEIIENKVWKWVC